MRVLITFNRENTWYDGYKGVTFPLRYVNHDGSIEVVIEDSVEGYWVGTVNKGDWQYA